MYIETHQFNHSKSLKVGLGTHCMSTRYMVLDGALSAVTIAVAAMFQEALTKSSLYLTDVSISNLTKWTKQNDPCCCGSSMETLTFSV